MKIVFSLSVLGGVLLGCGTTGPPIGNAPALSTPLASDSMSSITVTTNGLHLAYIDASYTAVLSASCGVPPYSWSISSGQLPPGLSLTNAGGQITGTPTQGGNVFPDGQSQRRRGKHGFKELCSGGL